MSDVVINTGTPQGTALSPFLLALYDSSIVSRITDDEEESRDLIESLGRCETTKELLVDVRRKGRPAPTPVVIIGAVSDSGGSLFLFFVVFVILLLVSSV